jgi:hypothetical protein
MIIETIADPAGQDEYGMSGLAPRGLRGAWRVGRAFLIAERDAEPVTASRIFSRSPTACRGWSAAVNKYGLVVMRRNLPEAPRLVTSASVLSHPPVHE